MMDTTAEFPESDQLDISLIDRSVLFQIRRSQSLLARRFHSRFSHLDIRPGEYGVLLLIVANPGRKQTEIADALGIQRANFVPLVNALERRRLIERRASPQDKRSNALYLTPAGQTFVEQICRVEASFEAECTARLGSVEARDAFLQLLARLAV